MTTLPPAPNNIPFINTDGTNSTVWSNYNNILNQAINKNATSFAPTTAPYILTAPNSLLPGAQTLNTLNAGFIKVNSSGILSSTGNTLIQAADIASSGVIAQTYTINGQTLFTVNLAGQITSASSPTITATPSGTASGDLSNSYPNPTVSKIQNVAVTSTNATAVSNLTGINSGDQTITLTGDITGSGTSSFSTTLATVNSSPSTYSIATITVNGKGLVTSASAASTTGSGNIVLATSPTLVTPVLGTPSSGNLSNCTNIPVANATGNLPITNLGSGTSASSSTFWRGDGTWAAPSGSGTVNSSTSGYLAYYATSTNAVSGNSNLTVSGSQLTTGSVAFSTTSGVIGTTTNNNAATGSVGEFVDSGEANGALTSSGVSQNINSISLTAGDWDIYATVVGQAETANMNNFTGGINTTSATVPSIGTTGYFLFTVPGGGTGIGDVSAYPTLRLSISGTTTVYLVASASWTVTAPNYYCQLVARRRR